MIGRVEFKLESEHAIEATVMNGARTQTHNCRRSEHHRRRQCASIRRKGVCACRIAKSSEW